MAEYPAPAVLGAIAAMSYRIPCVEDCYSTVSVRWNPAAGRIEIGHPDPDCDCAVHPDGAAAHELAEYVDAELRRHVAMEAAADYGDLPVNVRSAR